MINLDDANASLCYGIVLTTEENKPPDWLLDENEEMKDFDDYVLELHDFRDFPIDGDEDEKRTYYQEKEDLLNNVGVELVTYGTRHFTMYILAARESVQSVSCAFACELKEPVSKEKENEWREKIRMFCEKIGIEFQEPHYTLSSFVCD